MSWFGALTGLFRPAKEVIEVFRPNAEARSAREHDERMALSEQDLASLAQFASEFRDRGGQTVWDSLVDGLNRLPRPLITLGILGLFVLAPVDPLRFLEIAKAYEAVPDGLWALLSVVVAFYFGGRMQIKSQDMHIRGRALAAAKELIALRQATQGAEPAPAPAAARETDLPSDVEMRSNRVVELWKRQQAAAG